MIIGSLPTKALNINKIIMYKTKANLKDEVYHIIRNDIPLREKIAEKLGITVDSVYRNAFRKSPTLSKPFVIGIIAKHLNKKESEILNQEEVQV